jgi:hypothetical protein
MNFNGSSQGFHFALNISVLLGVITGIGLLIYYFIQVAWYWPLLLFLGGSLAGGILFGLLDKALGSLSMSIASFAGWPASAVWFYFTARALQP